MHEHWSHLTGNESIRVIDMCMQTDTSHLTLREIRNHWSKSQTFTLKKSCLDELDLDKSECKWWSNAGRHLTEVVQIRIDVRTNISAWKLLRARETSTQSGRSWCAKYVQQVKIKSCSTNQQNLAKSRREINGTSSKLHFGSRHQMIRRERATCCVVCSVCMSEICSVCEMRETQRLCLDGCV